MKKLIALLIIACAMFCLSACDTSTVGNIQIASNTSQGVKDKISSTNSDITLTNESVSQPKTDNVLSQAPHKHNFSAATCTSASKCACGLTNGEVLGHNCLDATCTLPKKCKRCGLAKGNALGHDYTFATCTSPKKCKRCGTIESGALGHTRTVGQCDRCMTFFAPEITLTTNPIKIKYSSDSQLQINQIDYEIDTKGKLIITFSGEKIWGTGTDVSLNYNLIDTEGIILIAGQWSEDGYAAGDSFRDKQIIISNLGESKEYTVEITSSN